MKDEVSALIDLLAQFRVKGSADLSEWGVTIYPGYLEDRWRFEASLRSTWRNDHPQEYRVLVDLADDVVLQVSGVPLKQASEVRRDLGGRVERIWICIDETKVPEHRLRQFHHATVRVRLVIDAAVGRQVPKVPGAALELSMPAARSGMDRSSLDQSACKPTMGGAT